MRPIDLVIGRGLFIAGTWTLVLMAAGVTWAYSILCGIGGGLLIAGLTAWTMMGAKG